MNLGVSAMNAMDIITKLKDHKPTILGQENYKEFSVLIPLLEVNGETHILFEVRSSKLRSQPGDICFPGGKIDRNDVDEKDCAIRETTEELGIARSSILQVTPLDYLVSFGSIIYTFVGKISNDEKMNINKDEVEEVFTVPLSYLMNTKPEKYRVDFEVKPESDFPYELIQGGKDYDWRPRKLDEYFYFYEDRVIWGLTAKILTNFLSLIHTK